MINQDQSTEQANRDVFSSLRWISDQIIWSMGLFRSTSPTLFWLAWINALVATTLPAATALAVRGLVNALVYESSSQTVFFWLLVGFGATLLTVITGSIFRSLIDRMRIELGFRIQTELYGHSAALPFAFFEDPPSRDKLQRAHLSPEEHVTEMNRITLQFFIKGIQIASLLFILIAIEPIIIVLLLPVGIPYLHYQWRLVQRRFTQADARTENRRWIDYYSRLFSHEHSVAEIKLLNLGPLLLSRVRTFMSEFRRIERDYQRHELIGMLIFALASVVAIYLALTRAVMAAMAGDISIGDIAIYGSATAQLRTLVEALLIFAGKMRWDALHVTQIREFLAVPIQSSPIGSTVPENRDGSLTFEDVTFTYPGATDPTLVNVSFDLRAGETVALVGENGAGKTTIAKLVARFYTPDQGHITCNGVGLQELSPDYLRREIAFVLQHFGRYAASAADNLAFGDWERLLKNREAIVQLAKRTDVDSLIDSMPQGYDTMLGRTFGTYNPSGGEWQQLAISRALGSDSNILILDEPTANLDVRREYALFNRFKQLAEGRTTLLISHRFSTVRMADRILVIDNGQIVESGSHEELMDQNGMYHALYNLHVSQVTR